MSEERKKILEMLATGKITADEAERLIAALETAESRERQSSAPQSPGGKPRYLRIVVDDAEHKVNVRVPMKLIRAGIKLSALIPQQAVDLAKEESGIDLSQLNPENLDEIVENLNDFTVDIDGEEKVRIFCE
jgi:polyhydroxyalkanoate synthesis regulator phasin